MVVSLLDSRSGGLDLSPGLGHCVVFLCKTLYSHSASLHPGVKMGTGEFNAEGNPVMVCPSIQRGEGILLVP